MDMDSIQKIKATIVTVVAAQATVPTRTDAFLYQNKIFATNVCLYKMLKFSLLQNF